MSELTTDQIEALREANEALENGSNDDEHDALRAMVNAFSPEPTDECAVCGVHLVPNDFDSDATEIPRVNGVTYCPTHDPHNPYNEEE